LSTRSDDFEIAVKDAPLPDLFAGKPLLRIRLVTGSSGERPREPANAAHFARGDCEDLFASERDQRLYRVLDLAYLHPAPKQEAAADRLGSHAADIVGTLRRCR
jgi:hypothetical protein